LALWMTDVFLNHVYPIIRDRLGVGANFFLFACFLVPQFFFVWKIMPETKGRTLEEIEKSWIKSERLGRV
jgi:SP family arabinose:H+ symporter-like MFS transporter